MLKKLLLILAILFIPFIASASILGVQQGGTGSSTLSGILIGNGIAPVNTLTIGSNLTLTGTTLSATGGGGSSTFGTTSISALYPIIYTISTSLAQLSTAFSTTTTNIFSGLNTFNGGIIAGNATTTNLAITGAASNCNTTNALTTNSSGVVGCTAQPQGTVTAVSVATANGFAGSSSGGATPALTLTTTITGLLKGNGTAISAATPGTDYDVFAYPFINNATTSVLTFSSGATIGNNFTLSGLTGGGTLCLHVNNAGVVSAAAADCGTSGGTITAVTATNPLFSSGGTTPNLTTIFSTTTTFGLGNNGFLITGPTGIPFVAASSTLSLPNTALQNSAITVNGTSISLGGSNTVTANTTNALTFNNSGSGASSGSTFNGSGAVTVSYNTIGAQVAGTYATFAYPFPGNATTSALSFGGITLTGAGTGCATFTVGVLSSTGLACGSGGGGSGGTFSTTTSTVVGELINHPNNNTDIVVVGASATTTAPLYIDPNSTIGYPYSGLGSSSPQFGPFTEDAIQLNAANTYVPFAFAIGSSTPTATTTLFSVSSQGNTSLFGTLTALGAGTSTFGGGVNLTNGGCFAIATVCIGAPGTFTTGTSLPVNYATTATLPSYTYVAGVITEVASGALSVDGNNPTVGQRVLVKNETGSCTSSSGSCNNGIYTVTAAGSGIAAFVLTRATDYNSSANIYPGIATYVISGATLNDDWWAMTSAAPITVGTTGLVYTETSSGITTAIQSIGPAGQLQTGATQTFATTTTNGTGLTDALTITASGNIQTFTPSLSGTLNVASGGTGSGSLAANQILYTNSAGTAVLTTSTSTLMSPTTPGFVWAYENGSWGAFATSSTGGGGVSGGTTAMLTSWLSPTSLTATSTPTAAAYLATSTTAVSSFLGFLGIASSSPWSRLSIGTGNASSSVTVAEYAYGETGNNATSTTATLDPRTSDHIQWPMGTANTTLTLCGFVPGSTMTITVVNPGATAGTLTWAVCAGEQLYWPNGNVTPTQTTLGNAWDIYTFMAREPVATSTTNVIISGAQSPDY